MEKNLHGRDLLGQPVERKAKGLLAQKFLVPPFSVLSAREGWWQSRKRAWVGLGIQSEVGRGGNLLGVSDSCEAYRQADGDYSKDRNLPTASLKDGLTFGLTQQPYDDPEKVKRKREAEEGREAEAIFSRQAFGGGREPEVAHTRVQGSSQPGLTHHLTTQAYRGKGKPVSAADCGTSIFDPVLCELAYRWFCPPGGTVVDPFAGGSVRGIVAGVLGLRYWGSELSAVQVGANRRQGEEILGEGQKAVKWRCGDSSEELAYAPDADFVFGCPPYADLEVYSKDPRDLSNMAYGDFVAAYTEIIGKACDALKEDRFACFVVGDVRDPATGLYRNFPAHTTRAFLKAGLDLYNEAVLITAVGSLSIRTERQFNMSRKLGTTHQRIIVYVKGDPKRATDAVTGTSYEERSAAMRERTRRLKEGLADE